MTCEQELVDLRNRVAKLEALTAELAEGQRRFARVTKLVNRLWKEFIRPICEAIMWLALALALFKTASLLK